MKIPSTSTTPAAAAMEYSPQAAQVPPSGSAAGGYLVLAEVRSFLIGHLDRPLLKRFRQLTGHCLHVLWHDPLEFQDSDRLPVLCPAARAKFRTGRNLPVDCALCQRDLWRPLDTAPDQGRHLQGTCGCTCFWAGVLVDSVRPVTLALRADAPSPRFDQAVHLLRQVLHEAQAALTAELARCVLHQALRQVRLPCVPPHPLPATPAHADNAHDRNVVRRPLGLADVAAALRMNASYLSRLFSTTTGVNFHCYLGDLRLTKAKELLRDPVWRVCEVAAATGYSSLSHFDNVFKTCVGISPSAWRDAALQNHTSGETPPGVPEPKSKGS
ncbi:MAG: helix-turn-helix transcriptional regulator [Verrucomicrobia bacterium]|nr:helix-turn-helix transcriptional regulator [Verrucomicrobiota bacterium]